MRNLLEDTLAAYERKMEATFLRPPWVYLVTNPSIRASVLVALSTQSRRLQFLWRNLLITLHAIDVSRGVVAAGPIVLPHPLGIVIGKGVRIGRGVTLYQQTTLGTDGTGGYPLIGNDVTVYTGAVVVGDVSLPDGSKVRALEVVAPALPGMPPTSSDTGKRHPAPDS